MPNILPPRADLTFSDGNLTRRGLLKCSLWAGAGILWTVSGGVPYGTSLRGALAKTPAHGPMGRRLSGLRKQDRPRPPVAIASERGRQAVDEARRAADQIQEAQVKSHCLLHKVVPMRRARLHEGQSARSSNDPVWGRAASRRLRVWRFDAGERRGWFRGPRDSLNQQEIGDSTSLSGP